MPERGQIEKLVGDEKWMETFESKYSEAEGDLDTPCLEWQGGLDRAGYGRVHIKKHCEKPSGRNFYTHRLNYMINRGYITPEEYILHQCHNRLCGNPDHHKLGDHNDNMADLADSGRVAGENNHKSKLTEEDVRDIIELYYDDEWTVTQLMDEFDMAKGSITDIIYGRTWTFIHAEYFEEVTE
tara:strand:+ start:3508 stop:4056 length:549 start_codon:yes stop_codon:yes gene_type:complete